MHRGLTRTATLPISLVLLTRSDDHVAALTAFRHGPDDDPAVSTAAWLSLFLHAAEAATAIARGVATAVDRLTG